MTEEQKKMPQEGNSIWRNVCSIFSLLNYTMFIPSGLFKLNRENSSLKNCYSLLPYDLMQSRKNADIMEQQKSTRIRDNIRFFLSDGSFSIDYVSYRSCSGIPSLVNLPILFLSMHIYL